MNSINIYSDKNYVKIISNSEKYIEQLKISNKISVNEEDLLPSLNLIKTNDPLWGYYSVKTFKIHGNEISPETLFQNYHIYCGDCFMGECYLVKEIKK